MSEINDSNESNSCSVGSDSTQQGAAVVANPLIRSGVLRPSVLRSVLGSSMSNNSTVDGAAENNSTENKNKKELSHNNPFMREQKCEDELQETKTTTDSAAGSEAASTTSTSNSTNPDKKETEEEEIDERPDPLTLLRKNGLERSNMFAAAKSSIPRVEKSGFVFGQNVHERVVGENLNVDNSTKSENKDGSIPTSELLFSSVIENAAKSAESEGATATVKETDTKSLNDVAREYEESRAQKRKYEEVETFTGEENEMNIVDINCKLFAFVNSNWEERGRGSLRLNDSKNEHECSRVVFRTSGNLRLLLNTKVWAGMVAEHPSQKSLRLTAMDSTGKIKVFLVMARPVDINLLYKTLVMRIEARKSSHPEECRAAISENNGEVKNGNAEANHAASVAVPDELHEEAEPSPKKSLVADAPAAN